MLRRSQRSSKPTVKLRLQQEQRDEEEAQKVPTLKSETSPTPRSKSRSKPRSQPPKSHQSTITTTLKSEPTPRSKSRSKSTKSRSTPKSKSSNPLSTICNTGSSTSSGFVDYDSAAFSSGQSQALSQPCTSTLTSGKVKSASKVFAPIDLNPKIITVHVDKVDLTLDISHPLDCIDLQDQENLEQPFETVQSQETMDIKPELALLKKSLKKKKKSVKAPETAPPTEHLPLAVFCKLEDHTYQQDLSSLLAFKLQTRDRFVWKPPPQNHNQPHQSHHYELDELDVAWLEIINSERAQRDKLPVPESQMESLLSLYEGERYRQLQSVDRKKLVSQAVCCICLDGECYNTNVIVLCDMCNIPVHQLCYGVPFIPDGPWLCKPCLLSPYRKVTCIFCPNGEGAFKQTDNGHWAHVQCALWIPEVWFSNLVFLEPVDGVASIPASRWRLTCFICKCKGAGACIQCRKPHCYTAFHVTCAQHAGIYMSTEITEKKGEEVVLKIAFCNRHAPPDYMKETDSPSLRRNLQECRKKLKLQQKFATSGVTPSINFETLSSSALSTLSSRVFNSLPEKHEFLRKLQSYWKLKHL